MKTAGDRSDHCVIETSHKLPLNFFQPGQRTPFHLRSYSNPQLAALPPNPKLRLARLSRISERAVRLSRRPMNSESARTAEGSTALGESARYWENREALGQVLGRETPDSGLRTRECCQHLLFLHDAQSSHRRSTWRRAQDWNERRWLSLNGLPNAMTCIGLAFDPCQYVDVRSCFPFMHKGQRAKDAYEQCKPLGRSEVYMKLEQDESSLALSLVASTHSSPAMTHLDPDLDPESSPTTKPLSRSLDNDVIDLIISAFVRDGVKDLSKETEEAALKRQNRCRYLQEVSSQFAVSLSSQSIGKMTSTSVCV